MTPQSFSISLNGIEYKVRVTWNVPAACWLVSIYDSLGVPLIMSIPLVTGTDLLAQYEYVGIGGQLFAQTDNDTDAVPTFDNLGTRGRLYFVLPPTP